MVVPATFTPPPPNATIDPRLNFGDNSPLRPTFTPTITPIIPSRTPTPTPTHTPTYTPSPTPIPSPTPEGNGPYLQGDPNRSKLSIHVIFNNDPRIMTFVRQAHPAVIKGVDDLGFLAEVEQVSPNTIIVGRRNWAHQEYVGSPEQAARDFVQAQLREYQLNPAVDFWEGWNEPDPGLDRMAWYARFEQERVRELARYGFKAAIGGFATGVPEMDEFALFLPAIETAMQYGGILTLHEYSAPVMSYGYGSALPGYPYHEDRGSLTFRYRWYYEELLIPRGLVIPLVISEAGIDGIIGNRPGPEGLGWADFQEYAVDQGWGRTGDEAFINQLAWYDAGVRQDDYVLGFTVFTAGPVAQWGPYNIGSILSKMADYVRSQE
ncbi:MAG: hypothetical protein H6652_15835 [Ardenticatenaceae bacterium]|nr:hypothetical protein [Ardenticatenaceae bacterium]MCB8947034.1 hypothetical protein [Ardenticatenaceae bacterium]